MPALSNEEKRERRAEYMREYQQRNKDKVSAQQRQYREENREIGRRYYERHKDEINARKRERRAMRKNIELRRSPFYELFGTRRKVDQEEIVITQQTPFSSLFAIRKH